jgi:hypothetical protein
VASQLLILRTIMRLRLGKRYAPWTKRLQFLPSYQEEEMSVTDLCREYGISRPTAYRWIKRYAEVGPEALLKIKDWPMEDWSRCHMFPTLHWPVCVLCLTILGL